MLTFFFIFRLRPRLLRCHACGRCMCACVCWAAVMTCAAILLENSQSLYLPESCGGEMNRRFISGNVLFFFSFFFLSEDEIGQQTEWLWWHWILGLPSWVSQLSSLWDGRLLLFPPAPRVLYCLPRLSAVTHWKVHLSVTVQRRPSVKETFCLCLVE